MKVNPIACNKNDYSAKSHMGKQIQNQNPSFGLKIKAPAEDIALLKQWLSPTQLERLEVLEKDPKTAGVEVQLCKRITQEPLTNQQSYVINGIKGTPKNWGWGGFNYFGRQPKEVVGTGILTNLESINERAIYCLEKVV